MICWDGNIQSSLFLLWNINVSIQWCYLVHSIHRNITKFRSNLLLISLKMIFSKAQSHSYNEGIPRILSTSETDSIRHHCVAIHCIEQECCLSAGVFLSLLFENTQVNQLKRLFECIWETWLYWNMSPHFSDFFRALEMIGRAKTSLWQHVFIMSNLIAFLNVFIMSTQFHFTFFYRRISHVCCKQ